MNYRQELEFIKSEMLSAFEKYGNIKLHTAQKSAFDLVTDVISPEKCLVFEDAPSGIESALKAGATVVAVGGIKDDRALLCIDDFTTLL